MSTYAQLQSAAQHGLATRTSGKTRVVVQVGHCSQAVGAGEVAHALRGGLADRSDVYLVIAGCDGACFNAPQVIVTLPPGQSWRYGKVTFGQVHKLVEFLQDGVGGNPGISFAQGDLPPNPPLLKGNKGDLEREWRDLEEFFAAQHRLVLDQCGRTSPADIDEYIAAGGYRSLERALAQSPQQVIDLVLEAGLLGRGGAYFPAARKWQSARAVSVEPRYLVVNAEEGEPGLFKDRHLMEGDPHRLLEGMLIAGYAAGASCGYLYLNAEAELAAQRMELAIYQARDRGLIGENILDSGFGFEVSVRRGAGGYVCGEETTLLNTLEGERREPRLRPPFPTESGLFRKPTVINNVETLANVPLILAGSPARGEPVEPQAGEGVLRPFVLPRKDQGGQAQDERMVSFREVGLPTARGTKLVCLSGAVLRPGLVEVPMGTTLRQAIYNVGGGPPSGRRIGAIAVGGPSSGILPATELDIPLQPGLLHPSGVVMGAGGVVVLDERVSVIDVVRRLAAYNAAESCGKCTPCREGTPRMAEALDRLAAGQGSPQDLEDLRYLAEVVGAASLCGLGQMAGGPINSALHFFGQELTKLAGII